MFFPEEVERKILHDSTSKVPYDNKPLIKSYNNLSNNPLIHKPQRKIGGFESGVSTLKPAKLLQSSSMSGGGGARKPTVWQTLIKNTMKDKGLSMKEAIKYIKSNNLY